MKTTPQLSWEDNEHSIIMQAKEKHGGGWREFLLDLAREYLKRKDNTSFVLIRHVAVMKGNV